MTNTCYVRPAIVFTVEEAQAAADLWNFNCGPAALCAVLDMRPTEIRPHLGDFERKGYTNPMLMASVLRGLGVPFVRVFEQTGACHSATVKPPRYPDFGLVRVQWDGPWTKPGVPMRVRYRQTHWVAMCGQNPSRLVFDINATCCGGWLSEREWREDLVPWLIRQCVPKGTGVWWPTHCWEIKRGSGSVHTVTASAGRY